MPFFQKIFSMGRHENLLAGFFGEKPLYFRNEADTGRLFFLIDLLDWQRKKGFCTEDQGKFFFWFTRKEAESFRPCLMALDFPGGYRELVAWLFRYARKSLFKGEGSLFRFVMDEKSLNAREFSYKDDVMLFLDGKEWDFFLGEIVGKSSLYAAWRIRRGSVSMFCGPEAGLRPGDISGR